MNQECHGDAARYERKEYYELTTNLLKARLEHTSSTT